MSSNHNNDSTRIQIHLDEEDTDDNSSVTTPLTAASPAENNNNPNAEMSDRGNNILRRFQESLSMRLFTGIIRPRVTISINRNDRSLLNVPATAPAVLGGGTPRPNFVAHPATHPTTPRGGPTFHRNNLLMHHHHHHHHSDHSHAALRGPQGFENRLESGGDTGNENGSADGNAVQQQPGTHNNNDAINGDPTERRAEEPQPPRDDDNLGFFRGTMAGLPEMSGYLVRYFFFICVILVKFCYDHFLPFVGVAVMLVTFLQTNQLLTQEIANKAQKNVKKLIGALGTIFIVLSIAVSFLDTEATYRMMCFDLFAKMDTLADLLYALLLADVIVKCITVAVKVLIALMPNRMIEYKGRGRIFLLIEAISQTYRCLVPIKPWVAFMLFSYDGYERIFGVILIIAYNFCKLTEIVPAFKFLVSAIKKCLRDKDFGVTPTSEQLLMAGGQCPICHEAFTSPIMLECQHIFCDHCICIWFDREKTCPLCRAVIVDDPQFRDGSTTSLIQLI